MALSGLAAWQRVEKSRGFRLSRHVVAALAFLLLSFASALWAISPAAALETAAARVGLVVVFLCVVDLRGAPTWRVLAVSFALAAAGVSLYGLAQAAGFALLESTVPAAPASTLGGVNFSSTVVAMGLPAALFLVLAPGGSTSLRALGTIAFATGAAYLVAAASRGAWFAALVGLGIFVVGAPGRTRRLAVGLAILLVLGGVLAGLRPAFASRIALRVASAFDPQHPTVRARILIWGGTGRLLADRWATGVGAGNFAYAFPPHRTEIEARLHDQRSRVDQPHSLLLQILVEMGAPGLVAFGLVLGGALLGIRARARDPATRVYASAIAAYLVHGLVEGVLDNPAASLLFWIACGAAISGAQCPAARDRSARHRCVGGAILVAVAAVSAVGYGATCLADRAYMQGLSALDPATRLAAFERALAVLPTHAAAEYERGRALGFLRRPEEAASAYERTVRLAPFHDSAWDNLAIERFRASRFDAAFDAWERALELSPWLSRTRRNRAIAYVRRGRFREAIPDLIDAYHDSRPARPVDALELCRAWARLGNGPQALVWAWNAQAAWVNPVLRAFGARLPW